MVSKLHDKLAYTFQTFKRRHVSPLPNFELCQAEINVRSRHRKFMKCKAGTWTKVAQTQVAKVSFKEVKQDTEKFVVAV